MLRRLALLLPLLTACPQEVVVIECDGHLPDVTRDGGIRDTGGNTDTGGRDADPMDRGADVGPSDTAGNDTGMMDGGGGCGSASYCITALQPDVIEAVARQVVVFTPTIDNPAQKNLTFSAQLNGLTRRPGLPTAVASDLTVSVSVNVQNQVEFALTDVPPWYATTTFEVQLTADGPEGAVVASGLVSVTGNVLVSSGTEIFAIASDGEAASSVNFTNGQLVSGNNFIRDPADMVLASDGTLVVLDEGTSPPRIRRFELVGENASLRDFDDMDANAMPAILSIDGRGLTQLDDGRFIMIDYDFSRNIESRFVLWNADGTYDRSLEGPSAGVIQYTGLAQLTTGEVLTMVRSTVGSIVRIDLNSGRELGTYLSDVSNGFALLAQPDGSLMVGAVDSAFRLTPQGGRRMINMLPMAGAGVSWDFEFITHFGPTGSIFGIDERLSNGNFFVVDNDTYKAPLRSMDFGQSLFPSGVVTLQ